MLVKAGLEPLPREVHLAVAITEPLLMSKGPMPVCMMPSVPATPPERPAAAVGIVVDPRVELRLGRALFA
jgi:hypothetical protein